MVDATSAVVQAIQGSVSGAPVQLGELEYFTKAVYLPPAEPLVDTLEIHTLTGLKDYCENNSSDVEGLMIHALMARLRAKQFT